MDHQLAYKFVRPEKSISGFVESLWMINNQSDSEKNIVVLPDGRIDLFFSKSSTEAFQITLMGIGTKPDQTKIKPRALMFAISFRPLAVEYIFHVRISNLLDSARFLPADFWNFSATDLDDFDLFCQKASLKIQDLLPKEMDNRKQKLFGLIYESGGSLSVKELSEKVYWSSRQINRYFNQQYGISLKAYCNILRFRESLDHIALGRLFPEQDFTDQAHFIKDIKRFSGVVPTELSRNKNDRFILLSALRKN